VVVHECKPRPGRRGDPLIPGHADALRDLVAEETDPRIVDGPNQLGRAIARPVVDHRYVELDVSLAKHALQGDRQQVATIARGDHYRDRLPGPALGPPLRSDGRGDYRTAGGDGRASSSSQA